MAKNGQNNQTRNCTSQSTTETKDCYGKQNNSVKNSTKNQTKD